MNLHEIEKLLEKYFEGEASLSEEKLLRDFFASGDVPQRWKNLEGYFSFIIQEQDQHLEDADFDKMVMAAVKGNNLAPLVDLHRPWIYWIAGIAASLLILIAVFVKFDPFSKSIENTYKDPQTAYVEARRILLYVSSKFNKGTSKLEPVTTLETGLKELKPVAAFNQGLNEVSRLNQVDKVEKFITNN
jgi:hypothetical protein